MTPPPQSLADWLAPRLAGVPGELAGRIRAFVQESGVHPGDEAPAALARAAVWSVGHVAGAGCAQRADALDVLAADALVTHACEALVTSARADPAALDSAALTLLRDIAAALPSGA